MRHGRSAIASGGVALALVLAGTAGAGLGPVPGEDLGSAHGLRYFLGTYDNYQAGDIVIETSCGETAAAVGGGADASGAAKQSRVSGSRGDDGVDDLDVYPDDYWFAEGQNLSGAQRTIDVYAICRKAGLEGLDFEDFGVSLADGETGTAAVGCSAGTSVIGGGVDLREGNVIHSLPADGADGDERADDGWKVKGRNLSGDPVDLSAEAICLDVDPGDVGYRTEKDKAKAGKAKSLSADCPKSKSVSGGGFSIAGSAESSFVHSLRPRDSGDDGNDVPDDRWQARVVNGTGQKRAVKVTAICFD